MLGQLVAAQFALESAIAELTQAGGEASTIAAARLQLSGLNGLLQQIGSASGTALAALRREVTAATGDASAVIVQARTAASSAGMASAGQILTLQQARQAIQSVGHDLFDRHVLDPYLTFRDAEDERAYRERERERQEAYDRAIAQHSVAGDRLAVQIARSQLADAKAHGADGAPEFGRFEQQTDQALAVLQPAMREANRPAANATPTDGTLSSDPLFDDALAALKAAGVTKPSDSAPASGHGVALTAASDGPQRGTIVRS